MWPSVEEAALGVPLGELLDAAAFALLRSRSSASSSFVLCRTGLIGSAAAACAACADAPSDATTNRTRFVGLHRGRGVGL